MAQVKLTRILCIGDSRLRHLQALLNDNKRDILFSCYIYPGATLGHLLFHMRKLLQSTRSSYYDYILIMGGICDITSLSRQPAKRFTPAYSSVFETVDNFERILAVFRESASLFTQIPIIFLPVVGVHLSNYSGGDISLHRMQPIIDQAIPLINNMIRSVNSLHGIPTPNIADSIHHSHGRGGCYRTRYCRLFDGCHPNHETIMIWAREILKTITNYIYAWPTVPQHQVCTLLLWLRYELKTQA